MMPGEMMAAARREVIWRHNRTRQLKISFKKNTCPVKGFAALEPFGLRSTIPRSLTLLTIWKILEGNPSLDQQK
jgi:hypothetical protein